MASSTTPRATSAHSARIGIINTRDQITYKDMSVSTIPTKAKTTHYSEMYWLSARMVRTRAAGDGAVPSRTDSASNDTNYTFGAKALHDFSVRTLHGERST